MIQFIFVMTIIMFTLLIISIWLEELTLGLISSFGIMAIGVSMLADGVLGINNIVTLTLGSIFICLGAYIFLNGSLEQMQKLF